MTPPARPVSLQLKGMHCTLGTRKVLKGLDINNLTGGSVVAVVGRNGAGKSTLLRCIAGFLPCSASRLQLGDLDLRSLTAAQRAKAVRYLPQNAPGVLHLTVRECLLVALNARQTCPSEEARKRIAEVATLLGLESLLPFHIDELSGGQKQLVWLGQALVHQPDVLLLDEPLAALDPHHQHRVMHLLQRLSFTHGLIVMVVMHDLNIALRHADTVLVLHEGRVVSQGPPRQALTPEVMQNAFLVHARLEQCSRGKDIMVIDGPV